MLFCICACVYEFNLYCFCFCLFGQLVSVTAYYGIPVDQLQKTELRRAIPLPGVGKKGHLRLLPSHISHLLFPLAVLMITTSRELGFPNRPFEVFCYIRHDQCLS